jgi:hypothetical protein
MRKWSTLVFVLIASLGGCLDPYAPPVNTDDVNILVVDGFLDTSDGSATVTLSRAVSLSSDESPPQEGNAQLTLLDDDGASYNFHEETVGRYSVSGVSINNESKYRIHIVTQDGNEYQSDLMSVHDTPPIDSITWTTDDDNLAIRVNTHDFTDKTKYFQWTYEETWNYHAAVLSQYKVVNRKYRDREPSEMVFYCWKTVPSRNIVIGTTERLSQNIISQAPVQYIPKGSQKLTMKYSILVKQRGLSPEEYNYLDQLKKTTESIGGLFDPQPSQVPGNIHRINPNSPLAIGFFGAGNIVKERIFISYIDLPNDFQVFYPSEGCNPPDTMCFSAPAPGGPIKYCQLLVSDITDGTVLGTAIYKGPSMIGITLSSERCADCRYEGGVVTEPDFWQ